LDKHPCRNDIIVIRKVILGRRQDVEDEVDRSRQNIEPTVEALSGIFSGTLAPILPPDEPFLKRSVLSLNLITTPFQLRDHLR